MKLSDLKMWFFVYAVKETSPSRPSRRSKAKMSAMVDALGVEDALKQIGIDSVKKFTRIVIRPMMGKSPLSRHIEIWVLRQIYR